MSEISNNIILVILVTSFATYLSRFLGVLSSEKIKETSKIFKWFNCIAYATLAALIARMVIFPAGVLSESIILFRLAVLIAAILLYLITLFYLSNSYELDDAILKVIFIGLASLTFPHILLEYLLEKK